MYRGPTINHSLLSPSGRVSTRARSAAMSRELERLAEGLTFEPPPQVKSNVPERIARLECDLADLRTRAAAGDRPRFHGRQADLCERLIRQLRAKEQETGR